MSKNLWDDVGVDVSDAESSIEAMEMAGLDWDVDTHVPKYSFSGDIKSSPEGQIVVRQDTGEALGVVGNRYTPVQNQDAFQFFDPLVEVEKSLTYSRAGQIDGGKRVFLVTTIDDPIDMGHGDIIEKHILLVTSHDGSTSIGMNLTPIRLWCKNMLNVATSERLQFSLNHTKNVSERLDKAKVLLKDAYEYYESLKWALHDLRKTELDPDTMEEIAVGLYQSSDDEELDDLSTKAQHDIEQIMHLFEEGEGITSQIRHTAYAGFNAFSEFADHHKTVRSKDRPKHKARFDSSLFGSAKRFKQKSFDALIERTGIEAQ
jgi:phage/plasmid-like protein (TIGR03299 family)